MTRDESLCAVTLVFRVQLIRSRVDIEEIVYSVLTETVQYDCTLSDAIKGFSLILGVKHFNIIKRSFPLYLEYGLVLKVLTIISISYGVSVIIIRHQPG